MPQNITGDIITVYCPECGKKKFSFSRNCVTENNSIEFACHECGYIVRVNADFENPNRLVVSAYI